MTVGSFTSVSLDPPLVAFLPDRNSSSWRALRESGERFCVNVLSAGQEDVCRAVAVRKTDRFHDIEWRPSPAGNPVINGAVAWIDCVTEQLHDAGDHHIVVGAVQRSGRAPRTLKVYRWDNQLPNRAAIHEAIAEAVTGIISLDNTLVIARHLGALPEAIVVIEVEPEAHEFGDELTAAVAGAFNRAEEIAIALAHDPSTALDLQEGALPAERLRHTGVVFETVTDDVRVD